METRNTRDKQSIQHLINQILPALAQTVHQHIQPVIPMFENFVLEQVVDTWTKDPASDLDDEISIEKGNVQQVGLRLKLESFNKPGAEPFDVTKNMLFKLEYSSYTVGPDKNSPWLEKVYQQRWEKYEYEEIAEQWTEELIDSISAQLVK
ncbi:hypothetical protein DP923_12210 [Pontibacter arcticus]|uniref:Uncharacterized protein n=2 Tax=Pontibacter arcticus TaxID=2080288 RepID=A0A364REA1_9BACT|nr:hypothetical protein DP923_12210 [Pontibacter arcticus]